VHQKKLSRRLTVFQTDQHVMNVPLGSAESHAGNKDIDVQRRRQHRRAGLPRRRTVKRNFERRAEFLNSGGLSGRSHRGIVVRVPLDARRSVVFQ
jgi:hypothetical protein